MLHGPGGDRVLYASENACLHVCLRHDWGCLQNTMYGSLHMPAYNAYMCVCTVRVPVSMQSVSLVLRPGSVRKGRLI